MFGYIYKTTNLINGKIYIGKKHSTKFLGDSYLGSGIILSEAINKYGKENFKVELVDIAESLEELNQKEKYFIDIFNSRDLSIGYNIAPGGDGGCVWGNPENHPTLGYDKSGKNNGAFGRKWYNNGIKTIYLKPDEEVPEGFHPGTLCKPGLGRIRIYSPDGKVKAVLQKDLQKFLLDGWITCTQKQQWEKDELKKKRDKERLEKYMEREKNIMEERKTRPPRTSWLKGLTKETDERVKKMAEKKIGNTYSLGKTRTEITKKRISESMKGHKNSPESRAKLSETCRNRTAEQQKIVSQHCSEAQKNLCWVTNGSQTLRVRLAELDNYIQEGFRRGRK